MPRSMVCHLNKVVQLVQLILRGRGEK